MKQLRRVMLVEDDEDIAVLAGIALQDFASLEFHHFARGEDAIAGAGAVQPDLVILDYRLGTITGAEVLQRLRSEAQCPAPIIFMTASLMPDHVNQLLQFGALAVIPKPFDPLTLGDQIKEIWEAHHA